MAKNRCEKLPDNLDIATAIAIAMDWCPDVMEMGFKGMHCEETYGYRSWYDWSVDHWGTKWNAYDGSINDQEQGFIEATFLTAWSPPEPVIAKLAEMYPQVAITHHYLDEGGGFAGTAIYANGKKVSVAEVNWAYHAQNVFGLEIDEE